MDCYADARTEFKRAIALTSNLAEHDLLRARISALPAADPTGD